MLAWVKPPVQLLHMCLLCQLQCCPLCHRVWCRPRHPHKAPRALQGAPIVSPAVRCCSSNSSRWHNQRPGATAAHTPMQRLLLLQPLHGLCCPDQHSRSHCAASRCRMLRGRTSWHGSSSCHCVPWCAGCCCPAAPLCWPCWYLVLTVGAEFWPHACQTRLAVQGQQAPQRCPQAGAEGTGAFWATVTRPGPHHSGRMS